MKRQDNGTLKPATDHPVYRLFTRSPDLGTTTPTAWRMAFGLHALVWGNAYAEVVRDATGVVRSLELRDPAYTLPFLELGDLYYKTFGRDIPGTKIVHVRALSREGIYGYSPVMLARQALGLGLSGERFAGQYMSKGLQSSGMIYTPDNMSPEAREEMAKEISGQLTGDGAFGLLVLPPGCKWEATSADPDKAQLLESRKYQVLEVCRLFGVPPHKVMSFEHAAYSTIEASNLEYATGTLGPWATIFEEALNLRILSEDEHDEGYCFKHDFKQLLRGDSASRAAYWMAMKNVQAVDSNTIAIEEGFDPYPGGEAHQVPLNMADASAPKASNAPTTEGG
jgi:HK97 family phage portal protein